MTEDSGTGERKLVPAQRIILTIGSTPSDGLCQELAGKVEQVIPIGDSVSVGRIAEAVQTGFEAAYVLE